MNRRPIDPDGRLAELLATAAIDGLSEVERAELDTLLKDEGLSEADVSLEPLVADLAAGVSPRDDLQPLPAALRSRLEAAGESFARRQRPAAITSSSDLRWRTRARLAWLAAAAALLLAAIAWRMPRSSPARGDLAARVNAAPDVLRVAFADWDKPEIPGVTGEAVWSESSQSGYLRLKDLPKNDPASQQYQLWIVDRRGMGQRISGALFDSPGTPEAIVPIEPGIRVQGAAAFAVTIEKPGGVWVSDMTRRVVIGAK